MRNIVLLLAVFLSAVPTFAFDPTASASKRIGILRGDADTSRAEQVVMSSLPGFLRDELRRAGHAASVIPGTMDDLEDDDSEPFDLYVEINPRGAYREDVGGVATGGRIGHVGVGGELSMSVTRAVAELNVYDGHTLELLDRFELVSSNSAPALTAIGLGDGFFSIWIPIRSNGRYTRAARDLALDGAAKLRQLSEGDSRSINDESLSQ